ncbi:hypothetical protein ACFPT7_00030 [Acidicapsa dinghuensis]|uniref:Uncharacterized protein n=1 Tax=Acidicapsa dinghuensis TaxID=2218256 RepID=A0ABW1E8W5_9BACT|nr:hypothetical protein [Acidicapsa dinghuensis]
MSLNPSGVGPQATVVAWDDTRRGCGVHRGIPSIGDMAPDAPEA